MARGETVTIRTPRGTKRVSQAFFAALDEHPEDQRSGVARAAQSMIREELTKRRDKAKAASAKLKARSSAAKRATPAAASAAASPAKATKPRKSNAAKSTRAKPSPASADKTE